MAVANPRKLFVNIVVRDLKAAMDFFAKLGFEFNPQFTDENAACMIVSDEAYFMLLTPPHFAPVLEAQAHATRASRPKRSSRSRAPAAPRSTRWSRRRSPAGGAHAMDPEDHGFMYQWSFYDLDGHHWEVVWMDPKAVE